MSIHALLLAAMFAPAFAQYPRPAQDLISELAAKIVAAVRPVAETTLTIAAVEREDPVARRQLLDAITAALRAAGIRVVDRAAAAGINVACLDNMREHACLAEIARGAARDVVAAARPHDTVSSWGPASAGPTPEPTRGPAPLFSLDVHPVFAQRSPILDVAPLGDRLLVLDPAAVTLYQRTDAGWRRLASQPIPRPDAWPRDVRGRLRLDGLSVEALLPGVTCRGNADLSTVTCVDGRQAWPIGLDNSGVDPSRNHFATPEGLPFVGAAPLDAASGADWLVADDAGRLAFLDRARRRVAVAGSADDVVAVAVPCARGSHVVVSSPSLPRDGTDALRVFRVVDRQLVPVASPVPFAGGVTALWAAPGAAVATAVMYDSNTEWYEAFHIGIACDR